MDGFSLHKQPIYVLKRSKVVDSAFCIIVHEMSKNVGQNWRYSVQSLKIAHVTASFVLLRRKLVTTMLGHLSLD